MVVQKKITVVYIITKLELGGAQKVCLALAQGLSACAITPILISGSQGLLVDKAQQLSDYIQIETLQREIGWQIIGSEIKSFLILIKKLKELKAQHPCLIVHTHSTKAGLLGRWAAFCAGISVRVHTIHGYGFHDHQNSIAWLIMYVFEFITSFITTRFVCVSTYDSTTGSKLLPGFKRKHSLIRAAVKQEQFRAMARVWPIPPLPFVFGSVACFKPQKNLFDLLKAFRYVHTYNSTTRLEIIGDGYLRPELEHWITDHALESVVTLHGWQSNVAPLMNRWHAFALSSLWEGLPCAVVEARLLKLPVVCYNTTGISDVIFHGYNGLISPTQQWEQLAQDMLVITSDSDLYKKLSTYQDDLTEFSIGTMLKRHNKLYNELYNNLTL